MWFARLFGGRVGDDNDDQPTATPVPRKEVPRGAHLPSSSEKSRRRSHDFDRKGFDPYNSGAHRRDAWERVSR